MPDLARPGPFEWQGITPLAVENERGDQPMADLCVHMMHVAI
jgi:hypothetical protein